MKKTVILTTLGVILIIGTWILVDTKSYKFFTPINSPKPNQIETTNVITRVDNSRWNRAQLHQDISVLIPQAWGAGTDGVYNYDQTKTTGVRDPNFPENSFKCVFYKDSSLRSKIRIENEQTLNTMPKVTIINGKWNDKTQDTMRQVDEAVKIYTYFDNNEEVYTECNVFKGELLADDKNILENIILTIQSQTP